MASPGVKDSWRWPKAGAIWAGPAGPNMAKAGTYWALGPIRFLGQAWKFPAQLADPPLAHVNLDMRAEVLHFHAQGSRARISLSLIGYELTPFLDLEEVLRTKFVGPPRFAVYGIGLQGQAHTAAHLSPARETEGEMPGPREPRSWQLDLIQVLLQLALACSRSSFLKRGKQIWSQTIDASRPQTGSSSRNIKVKPAAPQSRKGNMVADHINFPTPTLPRFPKLNKRNKKKHQEKKRTKKRRYRPDFQRLLVFGPAQ